MRPSSRRSRLSLAWAALLIVGLLLPLTTAGLAPPALAKRAAATLDDAVAAALTDAGYRNANRVNVVPAEKQGDWSFGTAALLDTAAGESAPDIVFYIAERDGKRWRAEVEPTAAYGKLLRQAPKGLVPDVFLDIARGVRAQADPSAPRWAMPVEFPTSVRLRQGGDPAGGAVLPIFKVTPEAYLACFSSPCATPTKAMAMASGYLTKPCDDGSGVSPLIVIQHADGWRSTYDHVGPIQYELDPDRYIDAGPVKRQQQIGTVSYTGRAGQCGWESESSYPQVDVHLSRMTTNGEEEVSLIGQTVGGWTFQQSPAGELCMQKRTYQNASVRELQTVCDQDTFINDGSRGDGVTHTKKPGRPKQGDKVGVTMTNLPSGVSGIGGVFGFKLQVVYFWRGGDLGANRQKVVKDFALSTSDKALYVSFREPRGIPSDAKLCIRFPPDVSGILLSCT